MAGQAVEPGKIFVGGLSWETCKEGLKGYFEQYGEVSDCVIMQDAMTKKPRGFGFVTFVDSTSVAKALASGPHVLDDKNVDPKPATMKSAIQPSTVQSGPAKKVFVGGLAAGTTDENLIGYFSTFGKVVDVDLKYDKTTQRMRGFGFVGFEDEEVVEKICQTHFHQINGKTVEVKKAEPRYSTAAGGGFRGGMGGGYQGQQGFGGGYGGSRGGYGGQLQYGYGGGGYGNYGGQTAGAGQGGYGGGYGYGYGQGGQYSQYPAAQAPSYGYDRYSGGQQTAGTADQTRSDYPTGNYYSQGQVPGAYQDSSYTSRSTYGTAPDSYTQQSTYNYGETPGYSSYTDSQGGGKAYSRGGAGGSRSFYGTR